MPRSTDIVLMTINARYSHTSLGLRYLKSNLQEYQKNCAILEFTNSVTINDIVVAILDNNPKIVGVGVYIWNTRQSFEVITAIKKLRPDIYIVAGGPQVSHGLEQLEFENQMDYVIQGEGENSFYELCGKILSGNPPQENIIKSSPLELKSTIFPYDFYTQVDINNRKIYVEASRGCPYRCEFCLSSIDKSVRYFELNHFLIQMQKLWDRGARIFKFVDRTFNLNIKNCETILDFFLDKVENDLHLSFEIVPDRLPASLKKKLMKFPPNTLQFEVGIQTFNETTAKRIGRPQNNQAIIDNIRFLKNQTQTHLHTDLILGLPGDSIDSIETSFNMLYELAPQEIQVGILKYLKGTAIGQHNEEWGMKYSEVPPYEIMENNLIDFKMMQRLRRFARFWDLVSNSGNFPESLKLICSISTSPFCDFMSFSDWIYQLRNKTHQIALSSLAKDIYEFLKIKSIHSEDRIEEIVRKEFMKFPGRTLPKFIEKQSKFPNNKALKRQLNHL